MKLSEDLRDEIRCWGEIHNAELWATRIEILEETMIKIEKMAYGPVPRSSTSARVLTQIEKLAKNALDKAERG